MTDDFSAIARQRYEFYKLELMRQGSKGLVVLGICLFPLFAFLDYYAHPEHYLELWLIRFSTTAVLLVFFILISLGRLQKRPLLLSTITLWIATASITLMCMVLDGYQSPYYAGVNLIMLAAVLVVPVGGRCMAFITSSILTIYIFGILVDANFQILHPWALLNNLYFLSATAIIGVVASYLTEKLRSASFHQYLELERIQSNLKLQDEIKSKFFANVSHELRTPLTLILGPIKNLLNNQQLSKNLRPDLQIAERNAEALLRQVANLLDISKIDARESGINYSMLDLAVYLRSIAAQFSALAQQEKIDFKFITPEHLPAVVDQLKMERILVNLLSNAFKFTPPQGKIICELTEVPDGFVELKVSDSGVGVVPEQRENVFQRFYQSGISDTRKVGGTGLGLAIVKEYISMLRGTIELGSSPFGGAEFKILIPKQVPEGIVVNASNGGSGIERIQLDVAYLQNEIRKAPVSDQQALVKDGASPRVLIVEDNLDMSDLIQSILEQKYQVLKAFNGRDGIQKILQHNPDLVLTDIMMPDCSGIELLEEVRSHTELDSIPIIILTAKADDNLRVDLLKKGAQDYILKPFIPEELEARIHNQLIIKRTRELLQRELASKESDIELLVVEISERQKELERTLAVVKSAKNEAEEALELREEFISLASHELNTPLTSLQLQTQVAKRKLMTQEDAEEFYPKLIDSYESQLKRLIRLVGDMLDISKIRTGEFRLERAVTELNTLVTGVISRLPEKSRSLINLHYQEQVFGYWDPYRIEQVILNLLTNALKYGDGKPVDITIAGAQDEGMIMVQDQGIGVARDKQEIIFGRFERAVTAKDFSGLGLGLYITRQIVEIHGGSISLASEPGKGSVFTVRLPCQQELDGDH
jgi:signal transduction histidine kinase